MSFYACQTLRSRAVLIGIASWLSAVLWFVLFVILWRMDVIQPHGMLVVTALFHAIAVVVALFALLWLSFARREARRWTLGWFLIGIFPVLLIGVYAVERRDAFYLDDQRDNSHVVHRVGSLVASSLLEMNSWWQFSHGTDGTYVRLYEHTNLSNASELVSKMDKHVETMANRLGQLPPTTTISWVRDDIIGIEGLASGPWAICRDEEDFEELQYLDKHEVAHALIFSLSGPDQNPPTLLVEGWAESQSVDRKQLIDRLVLSDAGGQCVSLDTLVGPSWYHRGSPLVYSYGGPLVLYIMEAYSGEKFFELYRSARPETFPTDVERTLGADWPTVQRDFWIWLLKEADRGASEIYRSDSVVKLGDGVKSADWEELNQGVTSPDNVFRLPEDAAYQWKTESHDIARGRHWSRTVIVAFEQDDFWMQTIEDGEPTIFFRLSGDEVAMVSFPVDGSDARMTFAGEGYRQHVCDELWRNTNPRIYPAGFFPSSPAFNQMMYLTHFECQSLQRPTADSPDWIVNIVASYNEDNPEKSYAWKGKFWLDPSKNLAIRRALRSSANGDTTIQENQLGLVGGVPYPIHQTITTNDEAGNVNYREVHHVTMLSPDDVNQLKHLVGQQVAHASRPRRWDRDILGYVLLSIMLLTGVVCIVTGRSRIS